MLAEAFVVVVEFPVLAEVFVVVVVVPGCIHDWSIFEFPQASAAVG